MSAAEMSRQPKYGRDAASTHEERLFAEDECNGDFSPTTRNTTCDCVGSRPLRPGGLVLAASISSGVRVQTPLKVRRWVSTLLARCAIRKCVFGCAWPR
jgi:hypothetical protein